MNEEEFREIPGFPRYMVGELGSIVNISTRRMMKATRNPSRGNYVVGLVARGKQSVLQVDRLVAEAFLDSPTDTHAAILHRDGDRSNNRADNLVWMPRWFVVCYMREINHPGAHVRRPFRALGTGEVFDTIAEFASLNLSLPSRIQEALGKRAYTYYFGHYGELKYL
jgi:hypothetical protein